MREPEIGRCSQCGNDDDLPSVCALCGLKGEKLEHAKKRLMECERCGWFFKQPVLCPRCEGAAGYGTSTAKKVLGKRFARLLSKYGSLTLEQLMCKLERAEERLKRFQELESRSEKFLVVAGSLAAGPERKKA